MPQNPEAFPRSSGWNYTQQRLCYFTEVSSSLMSWYLDDKTEKSKFPKYIIVLNIKIYFPNSVTAYAPFSIATNTHNLLVTRRFLGLSPWLYLIDRWRNSRILQASPVSQSYLPQKCNSITGNNPRQGHYTHQGRDGLVFEANETQQRWKMQDVRAILKAISKVVFQLTLLITFPPRHPELPF